MPVPGQPGMVMEYGRASRQSSVDSRNDAIEETMKKYNAVYTLLWQKGADGDFFCQDDYTLASRKRALRRVRGDDKTFAGESSKLIMPGTGSNLIATADREQKEQIISSPDQLVSPLRRELAYEFGINHIHFVPVPGQPGTVMEYGRIAGAELEVANLFSIVQEELQASAVQKKKKTSFKLILESFFLLVTVVKIHGQKDFVKGVAMGVVQWLAGNQKRNNSKFKLPGVIANCLETLVDWTFAFIRGTVWATRTTKQMLGGTKPAPAKN